jgi:hypothetical protein
MVNDSTTPTGALSPFGDESCAIGHPGAGAPESVWKMSDDRQYAPATLRNRDVILDVLRHVLPTTGVILASGLFATQRNAFEAFEPSDALLDARTRLVESSREEGWFVALVGFVRNDGSNAALPGRLAIGLAGVAFVADDGARLNVGSDVEQNIEMTRV